MTAVLEPPPQRERASEIAPRQPWLVARARGHPRAAILIGFTALSFLLFSSTWVSPFASVIGHADGDQVGYFWCLSWPIYAISHGQNPLFTSYLNYPAGANLMWTYPPLLALVMAPVTALAGPVFSYNLLTTLGLAVSGWLMAIAAHRFVPNWTAAIAAGLFFGFGPFMVGQALDHVVLNAQFAAPLMLLLLHEAVVRQRWRPWRVGLAMAVVFTFQLLTFAEGAAVLVLISVIAVPVLWLVRDHGWRDRLPYAVRTVCIAAAAGLLLCAYPLLFMMLGPQHLGSGAVRDPNTLASNLANIVVPSPTQLLAPTHDVTWRLIPNILIDPAEWDAYLGVPLLLILAVVIVRGWAQRVVRFAAIMAGLVLLISLGPTLVLATGVTTAIHLPDRVFYWLPIVGEISWQRLAIIVDLFVGLLIAIYLARARSRQPILPRPVHRIAMAVLVFSLLPLFPYPTSAAPPVPAFFTGSEVRRIPVGSVTLVAPYTHDGDNDNPEYWQAASGYQFRMIGGYVFVPSSAGPGYVPLTPLSFAMVLIGTGQRGDSLAGSDRAAMLATLTQDRVGTVLIGPMPHRDVMVRFMTNLLGRSPQEDQGVEIWWNVR